MRRRAGVVVAIGLLAAGALCLHRAPSSPSPRTAASPPAPATRPAAPTRIDAPAPAAAAPADRVEGTSIVVLRWSRVDGADRVALVGRALKPTRLAPPAPATTRLRWRLADAATGALLAEGPVAAPALCECDRGADHTRGCARVRHEAVVRLKVPHVAPRERLLIHDGDRELAALDLEGTS